MTRPLIAHRGKAFEALFASIQSLAEADLPHHAPGVREQLVRDGLMEAAVRCAPGRAACCRS
jgi:hypothetical protein